MIHFLHHLFVTRWDISSRNLFVVRRDISCRNLFVIIWDICSRNLFIIRWYISCRNLLVIRWDAITGLAFETEVVTGWMTLCTWVWWTGETTQIEQECNQNKWQIPCDSMIHLLLPGTVIHPLELLVEPDEISKRCFLQESICNKMRYFLQVSIQKKEKYPKSHMGIPKSYFRRDNIPRK